MYCYIYSCDTTHGGLECTDYVISDEEQTPDGWAHVSSHPTYEEAEHALDLICDAYMYKYTDEDSIYMSNDELGMQVQIELDEKGFRDIIKKRKYGRKATIPPVLVSK